MSKLLLFLVISLELLADILSALIWRLQMCLLKKLNPLAMQWSYYVCQWSQKQTEFSSFCLITSIRTIHIIKM